MTHQGGISPGWPIAYSDLAPYYDEAERLYEVHGQRGSDPTEPPADAPYAFPAIPHEPQMEEIVAKLRAQSLRPFPLPLAIKPGDSPSHPCILCDTCDGYPCRVDGKADAEVSALRPALALPNVTLLTGAKALRLTTNVSGREISGVEVEHEGERRSFAADLVAVCCGAVNSAVLLQRSANDRHPDGLANGSGLLGRNYMAHNGGVVLSLSPRRNAMRFQKTVALTDFYWGDGDYEYPMGSIQGLGRLKAATMAQHGPPLVPRRIYDHVESHAIPWRVIHEDLPHTDNRVIASRDRITLRYVPTNVQSFRHLMRRWVAVLRRVDRFAIRYTNEIGSEVSHHQCGTCRFGEDPAESVLDLDCRAHEIDNLYVVDSSFFPSSAAINPSLTIIANAMRVGDRMLERLGSSAAGSV